ncbi:hypothetical protein GQ55_5G364600 [Panicum hallii var. hallii]|uniref:Uncharacterized protein n=1 Tax=Panicum hallii var. hallii TaxID=1504633 RepID=A0A2T7DMK6_9POAL|nr:hypothetical protein GQ55_5G364600 [Panicum hallii var. hallii]
MMELDFVVEKKTMEKKSEVSRANPRLTKYWKRTNSSAPSYGLLSLVAASHWMMVLS